MEESLKFKKIFLILISAILFSGFVTNNNTYEAMTLAVDAGGFKDGIPLKRNEDLKHFIRAMAIIEFEKTPTGIKNVNIIDATSEKLMDKIFISAFKNLPYLKILPFHSSGQEIDQEKLVFAIINIHEWTLKRPIYFYIRNQENGEILYKLFLVTFIEKK